MSIGLGKMSKRNQSLERVCVILTDEQRELFVKEAVEKHAGNMSHLFREILDQRYKLNTTVKRQGDKRAG
jgi:hypothetical protein